MKASSRRGEPDSGHDPLDHRPLWRRFEAPGTVVLVFVFLVWFVGLYVLAHVNISRVWPVS